MRNNIFLVTHCFLILFSLNSYALSSCDNLVLGGHPDAAPLIWSDGMKMRGVGPEIAMEVLTELESNGDRPRFLSLIVGTGICDP